MGSAPGPPCTPLAGPPCGRSGWRPRPATPYTRSTPFISNSNPTLRKASSVMPPPEEARPEELGRSAASVEYSLLPSAPSPRRLRRRGPGQDRGLVLCNQAPGPKPGESLHRQHLKRSLRTARITTSANGDLRCIRPLDRSADLAVGRSDRRRSGVNVSAISRRCWTSRGREAVSGQHSTPPHAPGPGPLAWL